MLHISFICWGMQKCFRKIKNYSFTCFCSCMVFYNSEPYLNLNSLRARMHIKHEHLPSTCRGLKPLGVLCSRSSIPPRFLLPPPSVAMLSLGVPFSFFPQAPTLEPQHSLLLDLFLQCGRSSSTSFS